MEDLINFLDHLEIMTSGTTEGMKNREPLKTD